jgi:hypothetical protein
MTQRSHLCPVSPRIDRMLLAAYDEFRPPWLNQSFMIRDVLAGKSCDA